MTYEPVLVSFVTTPEPVLHRVKAGLAYGWRRTGCGKDATTAVPADRGRFCEVCWRRDG